MLNPVPTDAEEAVQYLGPIKANERQLSFAMGTATLRDKIREGIIATGLMTAGPDTTKIAGNKVSPGTADGGGEKSSTEASYGIFVTIRGRICVHGAAVTSV